MKNFVRTAAYIALVLFVVVLCTVLFSKNIREAVDKKVYLRKYSEIVDEMAEKYSLDSARVYAVIKCESSFDPQAKSSAGAIGLMQIMPSTYEWICEKTGLVYREDGLFDPYVNIECGCWYLRWLYDYYGDWDTVHAAYNAGPGKVNSWMEQNGDREKLSTIPSEQVKAYVEKINKIYKKYIDLYYGGDYNE